MGKLVDDYIKSIADQRTQPGHEPIKVIDESNTPRYEGQAYWEEPSMLDKAKITAKRVAEKAYNDAIDYATGQPKDKIEAKKKGGTVKAKAPTVRGHGIEQRGKTKGRFV